MNLLLQKKLFHDFYMRRHIEQFQIVMAFCYFLQTIFTKELFPEISISKKILEFIDDTNNAFRKITQ